MDPLNQKRLRCKLCLTDPFAASSGANRKINHLLGFTFDGKAVKRMCFPVSRNEARLAEIQKILRAERAASKEEKQMSGNKRKAQAAHAKRIKTTSRDVVIERARSGALWRLPRRWKRRSTPLTGGPPTATKPQNCRSVSLLLSLYHSLSLSLRKVHSRQMHGNGNGKRERD